MEAVPRLGQGVVAPGCVLSNGDETCTSKVRQVTRRGRLRDLERCHEIANTHLAILKEMQNAEPRAVGKRAEQPIDRDSGLLEHDAHSVYAHRLLPCKHSAVDATYVRPSATGSARAGFRP